MSNNLPEAPNSADFQGSHQPYSDSDGPWTASEPEPEPGPEPASASSGRSPFARGWGRLRTDFESTVNDVGESDKPFSLLQAFWNHPALTALGFFTFALILLSTDRIPAAMKDLISKADEVVILKPIRVELCSIGDESITVIATSELLLDYSPWQTSYLGRGIASLISSVGLVELQCMAPVKIEALLSEKWEHLVSFEVPDALDVKMVEGESQLLESNITLSTIGNHTAIETVVDSFARGKQPILRLGSTVSFTKWGCFIEQDIFYELPDLDSQTLDASLDLKKLYVVPAAKRGLDIFGVVQLEFQGLDVAARLPEFSWEFEIDGCTHSHTIAVANGRSSHVELKDTMSAVNISVAAHLPELPEQGIRICRNTQKSPLDQWLSGYLEGTNQSVFVKPRVAKQQSRILALLLNGLTVPYSLQGSPEDEKLLQSIRLTNVQFNSPPRFPESSWTFSGAAEIVALPPSLMSIRDDAGCGVKRVKGDIFLFHNDINFGSMTLTQWENCTTARSLELFLIGVELRDIPFEVTDTREFMTVSRLLLAENEVEIQYRTMMDVCVYCPLGELILTEVSIEGETVLSR